MRIAIKTEDGTTVSGKLLDAKQGLVQNAGNPFNTFQPTNVWNLVIQIDQGGSPPKPDEKSSCEFCGLEVSDLAEFKREGSVLLLSCITCFAQAIRWAWKSGGKSDGEERSQTKAD